VTDKLEVIQLQFQKRNARKRGPTSSDQINDTNEELAIDLANLNSQWNNRLVPLTESLPNGVPSAGVDAFANGLDGANLYVDQNATASVNSLYFNTATTRPNSVLEQFDAVYSTVNTIRDDLENQISNTTLTATQISFADAPGLYASANVEEALLEVMTQVNALSLVSSTLDLSAVAQPYLPSIDDTFDIGSPTNRIRDIYLGPASLTMIANSADSEAPSDVEYTLTVDVTTGALRITETGSGDVLLNMIAGTGVSFPTGASGLNQALNDLTDVTTSPSINQVLTYNGSIWIASTPAAPVFTGVASNITPDVNNTRDIGDDGTPLRWRDGYFDGVIHANGSGSRFRSDFTNVAALPAAASYRGMFAYAIAEDTPRMSDGNDWRELVSVESSVGDLSDVAVSGPSDRETLVRVGSQWVNDELEMGDLGDTALGGLVAGDALEYDGADWVPVAGVQPRYNPTSVISGAYVAVAGDLVLADMIVSGINVTLPTAAGIDGQCIVVKNVTSGLAPLNVLASGVQTIDGQPSLTVSGAFETATFCAFGGDSWATI